MAEMTMIQAITDALRTELKNDDNVLVFGEDVGQNGGVFRATEGLQMSLEKKEFLTRHWLNQESSACLSVCRHKVTDQFRKFSSSASFSKLWMQW